MDKIAQLLSSVRYMTISTVDEEGMPWAAPVWYAHRDGNLYYWSSANSQHQKNIVLNPEVYITIFDSQAAEGEGFGLYARSTVKELGEENVAEAIEAYNSTTNIFKLDRSICLDPAPTRLFALKLDKIFHNGGNESSGYWEDFRVETLSSI